MRSFSLQEIPSKHNSDSLGYNLAVYRQEMIDSLNKEVFNIHDCSC